jgi:N-acetylated-alpha-linked acidic dipeptidase
VAVSGPNFSASAVPSLKQFIRQVAQAVPSPDSGKTVYEVWKAEHGDADEHPPANAPNEGDVRVGDLGSGSDFTPFLQHVGVPSTDIGSGGPYGVYHSVFDNYAWFTMNADPHFVYLQEMARVLGLEAIRMADTEVLPYDYVPYAEEITSYLDAAKRKAAENKVSLDFAAALAAASRFGAEAHKARDVENRAAGDLARFNEALRQTEADLVSQTGLPNRPWYKHMIYAPGEYTGYSAVVIPGVNEAIQAKDASRASEQLRVLTQCLDRAAQTLSAIQ